MRHWLTLLLVLALLPGCAYFKRQPGTEDKDLKKTETKNLAPGWNPAYDRGASYDRIEGKHTIRDMSEFHPQPGKTFLVKVRNWVIGPEAIVPTPSGVVYLEQQTVRSIELEGYEHALSGKADYSMEIHVLCAAPACPAPGGKDQAPAQALTVPDAFDDSFPFAWSKDYHSWAQPEGAKPGCQALILLAVHVVNEDKTQDVFVERLAVPGCRAEQDCPLSACGFNVGKTLSEKLIELF